MTRTRTRTGAQSSNQQEIRVGPSGEDIGAHFAESWNSSRSLGKWARRHQASQSNRWSFSRRSHATYPQSCQCRAPANHGPKDSLLHEPRVVLGAEKGHKRLKGTPFRGQRPRLTCIRLDSAISDGADNACEKAALVQRITHLVRFQAHRSVELHSHNCRYQLLKGH